MLFEPNSKLVMIGDSITDCSRAQPIGEGLFNALGSGYVSLVDALINVTYPALKLRVVNVGCSGNTVRDLKARWQRDVLDLEPDYLSIMIGTNDVWRQFDMPLVPTAWVGPEEYETTLRELVEQTLPHLQKLILMTPFYIEPLKEDAMRKRMDQYGAIVRNIATEVGAVFVDTQAAFEGVLAHNHSAFYAWDRVHPNAQGTAVLARAFLDAVGYSWNG